MDNLNWGYLQLGLVTLVFGGLQVWWISATVCGAWACRSPQAWPPA